MLDSKFQKIFDPLLNIISSKLINLGIRANFLTYSGFIFSLLCFYFVANKYFIVGLLFFLLNRLFDGLDGAVARKLGQTNYGGYIDIVFDFITYSLIPFAFIVCDEKNAIPGALLLVTYFGTGSSFLAFAIFYKKKYKKSFFYFDSLVGGSETIIFNIFILLFPEHFGILAVIFATLCVITTLLRIYGAKNYLR